MKHLFSFADKLIAEYHSLRIHSDNVNSFDTSEFDRDFTRWCLSVKHLLQYAGLDSFIVEYDKVEQDASHPVWKLPRIAGILQSARECLENGFAGKLKHLLHAEMFASSVDQAKELLRSGHRIPAAVICRIVIEGWLRDQGEKAGIPNWDKAKASAVNDALKNAGIFTTTKWRHIQGLLDVGNAAAHGNEKEFTEKDIQRMIDFAEADCM